MDTCNTAGILLDTNALVPSSLALVQRKAMATVAWSVPIDDSVTMYDLLAAREQRWVY